MILLPLLQPLKKVITFKRPMKAGTDDGTFDISTCAATTHVVPGGLEPGTMCLTRFSAYFGCIQRVYLKV